jgi:hypothetical protein
VPPEQYSFERYLNVRSDWRTPLLLVFSIAMLVRVKSGIYASMACLHTFYIFGMLRCKMA